MKATIKIDMDNAAFTDNNGTELARILRRISETVNECDCLKIGKYHIPLDLNGNSVGTFKITK